MSYPDQRARGFGGAEGNERLTAMTGLVLLVLLAVEGFTILRLGRLLTLHFFLGMLLLGPVGPGRQLGAGRHARRAIEVLGGRGARLALLITSLLAGLVIALLTVHLEGHWRPTGIPLRIQR